MSEKKLKENVIFQGKILTLNHDLVLCSNGVSSYREVVHHKGGAGVLFVQTQRIYLIQQYRYAYQENLFEIPAGKLEDGEDPQITAYRELQEETGYQADRLEFLGVIYPTCGYSDEKIYLYLAQDATLKNTHFDEDECITGDFYPINQVLNWIMNGTIKDAKTICAIQYYLMKKQKLPMN